MANENMKLSQNGFELIKSFEGLSLTAYQDVVGVWTIGYGHTQGVYAGMTITLEQANNFLKQDITNHLPGIYKYVTVELNQNQFDALASFHFNLGVNILQGSTLLTYINSKNWQAAANEMKKYVNGNGSVIPGLVTRRQLETDLFLAPVNDNTENESEEILMWVFYQANKNAPVRWFNGQHAYAIGHEDEMRAIRQVYHANTGKEVPFLTNWTDAAPYYNRLANVLNRKPDY